MLICIISKATVPPRLENPCRSFPANVRTILAVCAEIAKSGDWVAERERFETPRPFTHPAAKFCRSLARIQPSKFNEGGFKIDGFNWLAQRRSQLRRPTSLTEPPQLS